MEISRPRAVFSRQALPGMMLNPFLKATFQNIRVHGTALAKDMSRIGRNYLQTGFYTDVLFRQKHVRFIAINNGIDNSNPSSGEFAPFLNVMNEWYLRDQSTAGSRDDSKRYRDCKELTDEMIQAFVERIMVHPATKDAHGKRQREIEIYLKFIGNPATFHSPTE